MNDTQYIARAVALAAKSPEFVGCGVVIVSDDTVIGEAFNSQKADNIAVNHAEIKAVTLANQKLGSRTLPNATAYCSCEPCAMCLVALSYAKVDRIVFRKSMAQLFPGDPQGTFDSLVFIRTLNHVPKLEQLNIEL